MPLSTPARLIAALGLLVAGCFYHPKGSDLASTTSSSTGEPASTTSLTTGAPQCGNGVLEPGEQCDDGDMTPGDGCEDDCSTTPGELCGDGVKDPGEECDDGNQTNGDGCENNCRLTVNPACGDGTLDPGEQCDDGNTMSGDGCESDCTKTPVCGDGIVGPGEQCDDGNMSDDDACLGDCTPATCGDGIIWPDTEYCDDGPMNGTYDHCLADCSGPGPFCGDGSRNGPEECDDANQTDDDDCSNDCVAPRLVFVTAGDFKGNLGDIAGADAKCTTAATAALLPDVQWVAWLSDETTSPTAPGRMDTTYTGYYKLLDGSFLAHGWTDLTDGSLAQPISIAENGNLATDPLVAWSNTTSTGANIGTEHCKGWTSSILADKGRFGDIGMNDASWTDAAIDNPIGCSNSFHLYCFQNSAPP